MKTLSKKINWDQINESASRGQFFKVKFIKRTTGEERVMICRTRVKKHLAGTGLRYSPKGKNLLSVWDVEKYHEMRSNGFSEEEAGHKSYRQIPVDNIIEISLNV